jgi:hypothetical protein
MAYPPGAHHGRPGRRRSGEYTDNSGKFRGRLLSRAALVLGGLGGSISSEAPDGCGRPLRWDGGGGDIVAGSRGEVVSGRGEEIGDPGFAVGTAHFTLDGDCESLHGRRSGRVERGRPSAQSEFGEAVGGVFRWEAE